MDYIEGWIESILGTYCGKYKEQPKHEMRKKKKSI